MSASRSTTPQSLIQKELDDSDVQGDELPSEAAVAAARRAASTSEEGETGGGGGYDGYDDAGDACENESGGGPVIRYTWEELMEIKNLPLSKKKPDCLPRINSIITSWDSNTTNKKRSETPNDEDRPTRESFGDKRRTVDPRERLRKENEGIVLSPQRRSFNSGCFVMGGGAGLGAMGGTGGISLPSNPAAPVPGITANVRLRPDSPLFADSRNGDSQKDGREVRRMGSGRLMWERGAGGGGAASNGDDNLGSDYNSFRNSRDRGDDRYERRSFGRDLYGDKTRNDRSSIQMDRDRDRLMIDRDNRDGRIDRDMDSRYSDRRDRDDRRGMNSRYNNNKDYRKYEKEDEPEWFSGGPTSQHDTIELHGFDDIPRSSSSSNNNNLASSKINNDGPSNDNSTANNSSEEPSSTSASSNNDKLTGKPNTVNNRQNENSQSEKKESTDVTSTSTNSTSTAESQGGGVVVKQVRRSAGSGRTPSAVAANQNKDPPGIPEGFMNDEVMKKALSPVIGEDGKDPSQQHLAPDLYFEEFLKMDNIPGLGLGLMPNGVPGEESLAGGSRFSKWFNRQSPPNTQQQRMESPGQEQLLGNIMNDLEPSIHIPSVESPHLFAPISPAASSSITPGGSNNVMNHVGGPPQSQVSQQPPHNSLLEMLRRGQHQQHQNQHQHMQNFQQHVKPSIDIPGKFQSVEELEARMRSTVIGQMQHQHNNSMHQTQQQQQMHSMQQHNRGGAPSQHPHHQPPQDDEVNAFKKLLAQVSANNSAPSTNNNPNKAPGGGTGQPMSLLQMLNKSQQADQQIAMEAQQHQGSGPIPHQDFLSKLLHVPHQQPPRPIEQQQHSKLIPGNVNHSNRHFQVSPIPHDLQTYMNNLQPSRELLQRPEAQHIVHGLKTGELTPQNLMQQIANPGMQSRHRELLASILKLHQQQQQQAMLSPRNRLVVPPSQPLRLSPLPPNGMPQRIPSPRELQARTQSIMQNALIKKKLEEQLENFRKRQEQQQQSSGNSNNSAASPTKHQSSTIAFTPTSVLRNMTADKESDPQKQLHHPSVGGNMKSGSGGGMGPPGNPQLNPASGWGPPNVLAMGGQQPMPPKHGRPIVKGGMGGVPNYQHNPAEFPAHHHQFVNQQQQQHFAAQMQMQMQHHPVRHPHMQSQQPQPPNGAGGPLRGVNPLHQMLMQQRNMNEGGDVMGPALSPTSNQLARWFTPELWARANAGKLPTVGTNMLSLEELERIQHSEAIVHN